MTGVLPDARLPGILAGLRWRIRPERFTLVGISARERQLALRLLPGLTGAFVQLVVEPDGVTLLVPEADWRSISPAFPRATLQQALRVLSFENDLPDDLVGLLAAISAALAAAGAPILAVCTFSHDHLVIRERDLDVVSKALDALVAQYR